MDRDQYWMQQALLQAKQAELAGEVPVGAVLVLNDEKVADGFNQPILSSDPTAHAEVVALRNAGQLMQNYRLLNTTLYVTLEPCAMCAGAIIQARISRVVYGAYDPRAGAVTSVFQVFDEPCLNHRVEYQGGVLTERCSQQLKDFFRQRR